MRSLVPLVQGYATDVFADVSPEDSERIRSILEGIETRLDAILEVKDKA